MEITSVYVTSITNFYTEGNGLDTMIVVEGTVDGKYVSMEFDGQKVPTMKEAKKLFHKNAWLRVI